MTATSIERTLAEFLKRLQDSEAGQNALLKQMLSMLCDVSPDEKQVAADFMKRVHYSFTVDGKPLGEWLAASDGQSSLHLATARGIVSAVDKVVREKNIDHLPGHGVEPAPLMDFPKQRAAGLIPRAWLASVRLRFLSRAVPARFAR